MKMTIESPKWSKVKHGKKLLMIEFPNTISTTTGEPFKWVPRYDELEKIKEQLDIVEEQWKLTKLNRGVQNERRTTELR